MSAVSERTLINNRLRGTMRTGRKKRPFELAIKMSLVTFKRRVSMKQPGQRLSVCYRGNCGEEMDVLLPQACDLCTRAC